MNEPRAYYTEWNKNEKEKPEREISYTNAHIWNLEKWYWWIYLQGKNGETDIENRLVDMEGEEEREDKEVWRE